MRSARVDYGGGLVKLWPSNKQSNVAAKAESPYGACSDRAAADSNGALIGYSCTCTVPCDASNREEPDRILVVDRFKVGC